MGARHRPGHVDRERHRQTPGDADAPVGLRVRTRIVEHVHGGRRIAERQNDERGDALRQEFAAADPRGRVTGFDFAPHAFSQRAAGPRPAAPMTRPRRRLPLWNVMVRIQPNPRTEPFASKARRAAGTCQRNSDSEIAGLRLCALPGANPTYFGHPGRRA